MLYTDQKRDQTPTKEVPAILVLNPPNNVKELRHFLGMVQYYREMSARRSEMLAPLTDLVGECGETKTTRMNKTRKKTLAVGSNSSTSV
jgi:hypothetical protein